MRKRSNCRYQVRSYQSRSGTNRTVVEAVLGAHSSSSRSSIRSTFEHRSEHQNINTGSYYTMLNVRMGKTTTLAKRCQVVGLAALEGVRRMTLTEISANTGVKRSTCSNIISEASRRYLENGIVDICEDENLASRQNAERGCNSVITREQREALIALTLSDYTHCRMSFAQLAREGTYFYSSLNI
jgi:hypothetical protein